jgi:cytoplasmic tRNA 2-thiolation protein 2
MPSRNDSPPPPADSTTTTTTTPLCKRCQTEPVAISVRTEPVCKTCFSKYVQTKIVKRLETFRVKNSTPGKERTLLVPYSFGPSSTTLLRILSRHLKGQLEKTGRTGFKLHVLHILQPGQQDTPAASETRLEKVKELYPEHVYSTIALSDIVCNPDLASSLLPTSLRETLATLKTTSPSTPPTDDELFSSLLLTLPTPTSRADALTLLQRKLTLHHALSHSCAAILFSDTTTRLSERILSETAKGRGFALPWVVSDGESPLGVPIYYPVRELLSKEVCSFVDFLEGEESLESIVVRDGDGRGGNGGAMPTMMKNSTIDDLTRAYFSGVEVDYPSIVANVVRTTGKLQARTLGEVEAHCELCDLPLEGQVPERSRLCYGCIRTLGESA